MIRINPNEEVEIKLRVEDASSLRRRFRQLRARQVRPRMHERNTLYDTPRKDLMRRGQLLRVRTERAASAGISTSRPAPDKASAVVTFKGPAQASPGERTGGRRQYKVRSESEVVVTDPNNVEIVLAALGLRPAFHYEKFRTTYALPGLARLKVEFDETPIGNYLELEGGPSAIDRAAKLLGYARPDYIKTTYGALYLADCRRRGLNPADMLFEPTRKQTKRSLSA
jgi:adenylate cyclase, class 2